MSRAPRAAERPSRARGGSRLGRLAALLLAAFLAASCLPQQAPPAAGGGPGATGVPGPQATLSSAAAAASPTRLPAPTAAGPSLASESLALEQVAASGRAPQAIALLGERVYVACAESGNVCVLADDALERCIAVGGRPARLAADAATGTVYALDEAAGLVHVLSGDARRATWSVPGARSLALSAGRLIVGTAGGALVALDAADGTLLQEAALPGGDAVLALAVPPSGERLYAGTYSALHAVRLADLTETARAALSGSYRALAVSPDGTRVYAAAFDPLALRAEVVALGGDTLAVLARAPAAAEPTVLAVDPLGGGVYLLAAADGLLTAYDADLHETGSVLVGISPQGLAVDAARQCLYVANAGSDNVQRVAAGEDGGLRVTGTVATIGRYASLAWDAESGRLLVAASSADRVLWREPDGRTASWALPGYPVALLPLPGRGQVAALTRQPARLWLLSAAGEATASYPVAPDSGGLYYDEGSQRLYAGSLRLDLRSGEVADIAVPAAYGLPQAPRGYLHDPVRGRLYAIVHNGLAGSNGGTVLRPLDGAPADAPLERPGVLEAAWEPAADRLFIAYGAGMGRCGLQAWRVGAGAGSVEIPLSGCPTHLATAPGGGLVWVTVAPPAEREPEEARLVAVDGATLEIVYEVPLGGEADSLAIDARSGRVAVGIGGQGRVVVVGGSSGS